MSRKSAMFTGCGQIRHISWTITPHHRLKMLVFLVIVCLNGDLFVRRILGIITNNQKKISSTEINGNAIFPLISHRFLFIIKGKHFDHDGFSVYQKFGRELSFLHLSKHSNINVTSLYVLGVNAAPKPSILQSNTY